MNKLILTTTGSLALLLWQLSVIATQIWRRKTVLVGVKGYQVLLPRYLSHFWPWVRLVAGVLVVSLLFFEECGVHLEGDRGARRSIDTPASALSGKTIKRRPGTIRTCPLGLSMV